MFRRLLSFSAVAFLFATTIAAPRPGSDSGSDIYVSDSAGEAGTSLTRTGSGYMSSFDESNKQIKKTRNRKDKCTQDGQLLVHHICSVGIKLANLSSLYYAASAQIRRVQGQTALFHRLVSYGEKHSDISDMLYKHGNTVYSPDSMTSEHLCELDTKSWEAALNLNEAQGHMNEAQLLSATKQDNKKELRHAYTQQKIAMAYSDHTFDVVEEMGLKEE